MPHEPSRPSRVRRARRRVALAAAGVLGASLALAGCASGSGDGTTDITFHMSKPEAVPYFRDLVDQFNADQSEVHVTLDTASNLSAGFLRGNPPDVGLLNYNMEMARFHGARRTLATCPTCRKPTGSGPTCRSSSTSCRRIRGARACCRTRWRPHPSSTTCRSSRRTASRCRPPGTSSSRRARRSRQPGSPRSTAPSRSRGRWRRGCSTTRSAASVDVADFYDEMNELGTEVGPDSDVSFQKTLIDPVDRMLELAAYSNDDAASRGYGDGNAAFAKGEAAMYMQGPWAFGEIAKTDPDLELGTFPLPMTDDPDDLKVRVNLDLALWIPEASTDQGGGAGIRVVPHAAGRHGRVQRGSTSGSAPRPTRRPSPTSASSACRSTTTTAQFYQGASKFIPLSIPTENYLQAIVHRFATPRRRSPGSTPTGPGSPCAADRRTSRGLRNDDSHHDRRGICRIHGRHGGTRPRRPPRRRSVGPHGPTPGRTDLLLVPRADPGPVHARHHRARGASASSSASRTSSGSASGSSSDSPTTSPCSPTRRSSPATCSRSASPSSPWCSSTSSPSSSPSA